MQNIPVLDHLALDEIAAGQVARCWLPITSDALGNPILLPLIVARGRADGPVLGITAVVHGNELNGLSVLRGFFAQLDVAALRGTVVGVPVVNVPGFFRGQRVFSDGGDLNKLMPGKANGNDSEAYAHRFMERVVSQFQYLIDLHTASAGRINSLYIRADLRHPVVAALARLQHAQIILNHEGAEGTLRRAALERGIPSITVELGDPALFQAGMLRAGLVGLKNALIHLEMLDDALEPPAAPPVECERSSWLYTDAGGILEVLPGLAEEVASGQEIAVLTNIFGDVLRRYTAPEAGIVIGKSINPVNQTGGRILHLGIRA